MARRQALAAKDELAETVQPEDAKDQMAALLDPVARLNVALRNLQILGQFLKNFPGSLTGARKLEMAQAGYELGARAWASVVQMLHANQTDIIGEIVNTLRRNNPLVDVEVLKDHARTTVVGLVQLCSLGFVKRISQALGAPELAPTYDKLKGLFDNPATTLVDASIRLDHAQGVPEMFLISLGERLKENPLAIWLLRALTAEYFHLFIVDPATKQRICAKLGMSYKSGQAADIRTKLLG